MSVENLKNCQKELLDIIEEVKNDSSIVRRNIWGCLNQITFACNPRLSACVSETASAIEPKRFFFFKMYPSVKKYCSVLSNLIIQIDKEIDYEEKVGVIAEKLSQVHVSLSNGETDSELERKIRENAGAIARIIS